MLTTIIFSLNRACQLHLLLATWERFVRGPAPHVTYCYTGEEYRRGYELARQRFAWADWRPQVHFRVDTLAAVAGGESRTMFLVDDMFFRRPLVLGPELVRPLDDLTVLAVSLRLSPTITHCFNLNRDAQPPPMQGLAWHWRGAAGDWGYPMSLDGHIFRRDDLLPLMQGLPWSNPNMLENALAGNPIQRPKMACLAEHPVVNVPANLVQQVFQNRTCNGQSAEELNRAYLDGKVIDAAPLMAIENNSPHYPAAYRLVPYE